MCGIIGYTGKNNAREILIEGLRRLEYRGYDSAGVSVLDGGVITTVKSQGRIDALDEKIGCTLHGTTGIGHTRWATHGAPTDTNAHPHTSVDGRFAIVHNGIIENYEILRDELRRHGFVFRSETDSEVVVNLLDYYYDGDFRETVMKAVSRLEGSFALGIVCSDFPGRLFAVRNMSPLIIGVGVGENYFASDVTAFIGHTKNVIHMDDGQFAEITCDGVSIFDSVGRSVLPVYSKVTWDAEAAEKGGYDHFMQKEIMEQPRALEATINPRVKNGKLVPEGIGDLDMTRFDRIVIVACGSAYHAGVVGKYVIEELCRIPTTAELASEFRYSNPIVNEQTLVIAISQSGETADTLAAMREAKARGALVLAIVNVVGSSVATLADHALYTWAGPEIAVATTKGYTTQLAMLDIFAVWAAGQLGTITPEREAELTGALLAIPERVQRAIDLSRNVEKLAAQHHGHKTLFFIGRNIDYACCLESSLKLKEISYIHSEAYAAGELKHGTIALISPEELVVAIACHKALYDKTMSNIEQVKARGASVLAVAREGDRGIVTQADDVIYVPNTDPLFMAIPQIIPMQLFAYYVAKENGCDIDKPKNLAKSVTVE